MTSLENTAYVTPAGVSPFSTASTTARSVSSNSKIVSLNQTDIDQDQLKSLLIKGVKTVKVADTQLCIIRHALNRDWYHLLAVTASCHNSHSLSSTTTASALAKSAAATTTTKSALTTSMEVDTNRPIKVVVGIWDDGEGFRSLTRSDGEVLKLCEGRCPIILNNVTDMPLWYVDNNYFTFIGYLENVGDCQRMPMISKVLDDRRVARKPTAAQMQLCWDRGIITADDKGRKIIKNVLLDIRHSHHAANASDTVVAVAHADFSFNISPLTKADISFCDVNNIAVDYSQYPPDGIFFRCCIDIVTSGVGTSSSVVKTREYQHETFYMGITDVPADIADRLLSQLLAELKLKSDEKIRLKFIFYRLHYEKVFHVYNFESLSGDTSDNGGKSSSKASAPTTIFDEDFEDDEFEEQDVNHDVDNSGYAETRPELDSLEDARSNKVAAVGDDSSKRSSLNGDNDDAESSSRRDSFQPAPIVAVSSGSVSEQTVDVVASLAKPSAVSRRVQPPTPRTSQVKPAQRSTVTPVRRPLLSPGQGFSTAPSQGGSLSEGRRTAATFDRKTELSSSQKTIPAEGQAAASTNFELYRDDMNSDMAADLEGFGGEYDDE